MMQSSPKFGQSSYGGYPNEADEVEDYGGMTPSMNMPVRQHHNKLEDILNDYLRELDEIKKQIQLAKIKMVSNEENSRGLEKEMQDDVRNEVLRVEKEFKKLIAADRAETAYLKQQLHELNQERIKINQNTLILDCRTTEAEKEVGFLLMQQSQGFSPSYR